MSISTPGGNQRRPSVVSTGKKPAAGRPAAGDKPTASAKTGANAKTGGKAGAGRPGNRAGGGKGRKITPVKVSQGRAWGPIALFVAVGVLATAIIGYGAWASFQGSKPWEDRADGIEGITNFRKTDPELVKGSNHQPGSVQYAQSPPVAGPHNDSWQNCMGDVYDAPIASEHAVHSLEHGAVWITYRPDLPADQVTALAEKVRGNEKMMLSPFQGQDKPISLQAWGYQLKVDNADDSRIDEFVKTLRVNASIEGPNALCSQGITATGTTPRDGSQMPQTQG
ncbi:MULTISPECIES: DUF3105 domain-containing protein [Micromonospora]|uniref:DUF3105 domain-containing protein n=1 Tax=Micromonospora yangpuensis TaxID=683228 RepID=A0A1C6V7Y2_9ACTN|nr:DUF3105 domain-containing protein [Micromonospora yangpuensis]GGM19655.1 hypothetical protein GCM10012279_42550 [Micromonospora yangpuensis]SCL62194.1 Protein of unknown function [Micromonospora yangpuensis]